MAVPLFTTGGVFYVKYCCLRTSGGAEPFQKMETLGTSLSDDAAGTFVSVY